MPAMDVGTLLLFAVIPVAAPFRSIQFINCFKWFWREGASGLLMKWMKFEVQRLNWKVFAS